MIASIIVLSIIIGILALSTGLLALYAVHTSNKNKELNTMFMGIVSELQNQDEAEDSRITTISFPNSEGF